ncbi:hypothetical protein P7K49_035235 [Saguinus oedipus]|uniref:SH3 domain-binding protein 5 n=1 Tax=Saguinus oedipus TaxID=9490 RepID=A0ABQ9TMS8_SAGOE|nr:hypothetical protein P7K49_035235 [Saguinus oedipus]
MRWLSGPALAQVAILSQGESLQFEEVEELEHLNQASEEINQVELRLDEARTTYRRILQESARKLNTQGSHLGSCIEKARPYYEARRLAKEAQQETQKAALRYERAVSMHNAAREMVFVAEQGVMADKNRLDPTWQEMLNHATCKNLCKCEHTALGAGWGVVHNLERRPSREPVRAPATVSTRTDGPTVQHPGQKHTGAPFVPDCARVGFGDLENRCTVVAPHMALLIP